MLVQNKKLVQTKVMRISRQPLPVKIIIDQKQVENVESFKYLGSILKNDGRCTCEIKCRIAMAKAAFSKKRTLFTSTMDLELRKKLVKCYVWSIALYGAETWTLRAMDQKHIETFEMWCWRRMEKIRWTDHVRNEDVLLRVKERRNILHEIRKRKVNWIGHILRRNCLLQRVTEGKIQGGIEVTGRQERRRRKLLDDLKERRGYSHLKEEALDRTMWRARFGRGFGPVVKQTTKWMNVGTTCCTPFHSHLTTFVTAYSFSFVLMTPVMKLVWYTTHVWTVYRINCITIADVPSLCILWCVRVCVWNIFIKDRMCHKYVAMKAF